jgi:hypothetical protein
VYFRNYFTFNQENRYTIHIKKQRNKNIAFFPKTKKAPHFYEKISKIEGTKQKLDAKF